MFCSNCGEPVAEGRAFCKSCGAPVATAASAAVAGAAGQAAGTGDTTVAEAATLVKGPPGADDAATLVMGGAVADDSAPLPPIAEAHKVVPPPDRSNVAPPPPPPVYTGYDQLQPGPGRGGSAGLVIGIVIAVIIVLAGAGVAALLLLRGGDTTASVTTAQASSTTTLPPTTTTAVVGSSTTATTVATSTTSGSGAGSSTTVDPVLQYLTATDSMVQLLTGDDTRIPVLADQINATAPNVPRGVYSELQVMMGKLDAAFTEMAELPVPTGFEESSKWLDEAVRQMGERIYATVQGIEAMYNTGSTSAAVGYFNQGRIARDNYRAAFQKFQESVPID